MAIHVAPELVEAFARGLVGAADVDGGPTDEQLAVLRAISTEVWGRDDLDPGAIGGLGPDELARALPDPDARRRFQELLVAVEVCRHPLSAAQVSRVEAYSVALGVPMEELSILRDLVDVGAQRAAADFQRCFEARIVDRSEPSMREVPIQGDTPEPELVARIEALGDLPEDTLGWSLIDFYRRNALETPGSRASMVNHLYIDHDMIHVIAGIEPTGEGEIALGAFQSAMDDTPTSTFAFLSALIVHEAGFTNLDNLAATEGTLSRPGAITLMAEDLARGARCTGSFAFVDHFEIAAVPLAEVRERFGVQPPLHPDDGHHHWTT